MSATLLEKTLYVPEKSVDQLEELIQQKFDLRTGFAESHARARALVQALRSFNLAEGSRLDRTAFRNGMQKLNCGDNVHIVDALFGRYDIDGSNTLDMTEFAQGLFGLKPNPQSNPTCRDIIKKCKDAIVARGGDSGFRGIRRSLRIMDDNGNKSLSKEELRSGMADYGVVLNKEDATTLFYYFDRDKSGHITITEFLVGLRGPMTAQREKLVRQAYTRLDKNQDGTVNMDDLRQLYQADKHPAVLRGEKTADEVIREFAASFWDKDGDATITEKEFLEYYADLSASIDNDQYFELMIRNAWRISGGKGQAANTANTRVLVTHMDGTQSIEEIEMDLGLDTNSEAALMQSLKRQGVTDILRVSLQ